MKLLDTVPERESEPLFDRLEYCRWTLMKFGAMDSFHGAYILKRMEQMAEEEELPIIDFQH